MLVLSISKPWTLTSYSIQSILSPKPVFLKLWVGMHNAPLSVHRFRGRTTREKRASALPPTQPSPLKILTLKCKCLNVFLNWLVIKVRAEWAKLFNFSIGFWKHAKCDPNGVEIVLLSKKSKNCSATGALPLTSVYTRSLSCSSLLSSPPNPDIFQTKKLWYPNPFL